jgi:TonB family protein
MRQTDNREHLQIRNPGRPDDEAGVVLPRRLPGTLFQGWGPKLMAVALLISALAMSEKPAQAEGTLAYAACTSHGAQLISSPSFSKPEGVEEGGVAVIRINLAASGQIQSLALARSSGNTLLDIEALHVARASRFSGAMSDCTPAPETVLYNVDFGA